MLKKRKKEKGSIKNTLHKLMHADISHVHFFWLEEQVSVTAKHTSEAQLIQQDTRVRSRPAG